MALSAIVRIVKAHSENSSIVTLNLALFCRLRLATAVKLVCMHLGYKGYNLRLGNFFLVLRDTICSSTSYVL